ncbi:hypothetical protein PF011_g6204 [Phytophthora fragariae]|uniref:Uncharacterized protein n=2 Tax=Phytophthora TaxID=4783 RepID=A0A6A3LHE9_9STRA|nr:hypothetical protein PF011_g6204 [Phytophthora fragariae]
MTNSASRQKANTTKNVTSPRKGAKVQQSKLEMQQSVGASFVLRLVLGLAPEKRAACQTLREILSLDNTARLVLVPTTKGLKPISGKTNAADWTNVNQHKLKHMVKQAQSDKFQEAMQQLGGQHLYDSIRTQLKQPAKNATKGQIQAVKIVEATKIPPPAPTSVKMTKVTTPATKAQAKNIVPAENPTT